jgi:hypothetical protein
MLKSSSLCLYSSNLGTLWLKIEQFWPFEEISIFSNGSHLENCVRQRRPVFKMAAITKNRNFFKWPKLLYFKPESAQIISIFSNGGHLEYRAVLTDTILKGDQLRIISAKFG